MYFMYKSKHLATKLDEKQFLNRLKIFCREKIRFDTGYNDKDVFVVKRKKNCYWLCKHYASVGRTDGYAHDCICFRYSINKNGYVDVEYRFGKTLSHTIPFVVCFAVGSIFGISLVYDAIAFFDVQWGGLCVAALFWIFGLSGMLYRSKKERVALEEHLLRICNIES